MNILTMLFYPDQGAQLQRELRVDEDEIKGLEEELEAEQKKYQEVFTSLQDKVEHTEVSALLTLYSIGYF